MTTGLKRPVELGQVFQGGAAAELTAYRRRRRNAVVPTVLLVAVVARFGLDAINVLRQGGDTRFGVIPYLLCVASAVLGGTVVVSLWRRAGAAKRIAMPENVHQSLSRNATSG